MSAPRTSADEHRKRLKEAYFDWLTIRADPHPLPKLTFEEAVAWARYAWLLRHEAWHPPRNARGRKWGKPPFSLDKACEGLILPPDYWQRLHRERKEAEALLAMSTKPLPEVALLDTDAQGESTDGRGCLRQPVVPGSTDPPTPAVEIPADQVNIGCPDPGRLLQIVKARITDDEEQAAVLRYLQETHARYQLRITEVMMRSLALVAPRRGRADTPGRLAPRIAPALERALHRTAMVQHLVPRLRDGSRTRNEASSPTSAYDAVAAASGCVNGTIKNAWRRARDFRRQLFPADP